MYTLRKFILINRKSQFSFTKNVFFLPQKAVNVILYTWRLAISWIHCTHSYWVSNVKSIHASAFTRLLKGESLKFSAMIHRFRGKLFNALKIPTGECRKCKFHFAISNLPLFAGSAIALHFHWWLIEARWNHNGIMCISSHERHWKLHKTRHFVPSITSIHNRTISQKKMPTKKNVNIDHKFGTRFRASRNNLFAFVYVGNLSLRQTKHEWRRWN